MSFEAVKQKTFSIRECLLEFAKENSINPRQLDFELLSHETLIQSIKSGQTKVVENVSTSHLRTSTLNIIQEYTINIFPLSEKPNPIKLSLSADQSKLKAYINIKKESVFTDTPTLMQDIKNAIWKKKLLAGFLIDIFENNLDTQLGKLLKIIPYNKPIGKELKFTVASGFLPIEPVDGKMEKIYEEKVKESGSVIAPVSSGELIGRYILPKNGAVGRTCDGKCIDAKKPRLFDKQPTPDNTITTKTLNDSIEYYAVVNGYPLCHKNKLTISNTLALQEANFKSTALIDAGDKNVDIAVKIQHNKSENEDAIGSGVKIDVKELSVNGSIAANVNIETETLNIDAQTHSKSKMTVKDKATIKLHRGDLTAKEAEIDILESGKVTASESVTIRRMLGGTVIAPIVKIDELLSNTTIIASDLIEVKSITGKHNKLIINPDAIEGYHKDIENLKEQIASLQQVLKKDEVALYKKVHEHTAQIERITTFKNKVLLATKEGKNPMKQDVLRIKLYQQEAEKISLEKENLVNKASVISEQEFELDKLYNKDLYAKVKSQGLYDGNTKVSFINIKTKEEISILPHGKVQEISLTLNKENQRIITTE